MALDLTGVTQVVEGLIPWDIVRIAIPATGAPAFDETTGQYTFPEQETVYEDRGAVQVAGTVGGVSSLPVAGLPWSDETRSKYKLLTPLDAPIAERDWLVTVVQVHQPGGDVSLIGRQWRVQDPSFGGTLGVLRVTTLDQIQQTREVA